MGKKLTERETRSKLLAHAKRIGAEEDLQELFNKWDRAIALAPPNEKQEMSKMAILEVQMLLDINKAENYEGITINGEVIENGKKSNN